MTKTTYNVKGMTCGHCVAAVKGELEGLAGVDSVDVDLDSGAVTVVSAAELLVDDVRAAVDEAGYELVSWTAPVKLAAFAGALVAALLIGLGAGSFFDLGASDGRRIDIEMRDTAFVPTSIEVKAGERVELRFHNAGQAPHDAFIGNAAAQVDHEREMRSGDGGHAHGESGSDGVSVDPGDTESISYTFEADDDGVLIGCHEPGHYDAGMRLTVNVV